ncbi:MAG: hypothetical protein WAW41_04685 [Methylobacter sp.]
MSNKETTKSSQVGQSELTDGLAALSVQDVNLLESVLTTLSNIAKKQTPKAHPNYAARYESNFRKASINDASRSAEFLLSDFNALVAKVQDIVRTGG